MALFLCYSPKELQKLAAKEAKYDAYAYVQGAPKNGGGGIAFGGTVCEDIKYKSRISYTNARPANQCGGKTKCTKSKRIALTSEVYHVVESIFRHIFKPFSSHGLFAILFLLFTDNRT